MYIHVEHRQQIFLLRMHNLRDLDVFLMRKVINYTFEARCHTSSGRSLNCRLLLVFKWGKIKMVWNAWTSPLEYIRQVASFYNNEFWLHKVYDLLLLVEVIKTRLLFYFWIWKCTFLCIFDFYAVSCKRYSITQYQ